MKKLLIASTALVATAGVAAADVNLSGSARFGAVKDDSGTRLETRYTLNLDGSTETDSGMEFFARVRIRSNEPGNTALSGARVGVKSGGLTIAAGNINGALDSMAGMYDGTVGLTGLTWENVVVDNVHGFKSDEAGANGAEVIYTMNGFTAHLSANSATNEIAFGYEFGDWTVALGHETAGKQTALTVGGNLGSWSVGFGYGKTSTGNNIRINAGFDVAEGTNVTVYAVKRGSTGTGYGIGVAHDLGGAMLKAGVAKPAAGGSVTADLGVSFNF